MTNNILNKKERLMSKAIEKIKVLLSIVKDKFSKKETVDGLTVYYDGDEIAVDTVVYDEEGNPIPDGDYSDGEDIYTIVDSKVTEIKPVEKEVEEVEKEEVVKVENACGDENEKKVEAEEVEKKEEVEEVEKKEEVEEKPVETAEEPTSPTTEELQTRIEELEKAFEEMFAVVMEMKEKQVENINKQEEIIREFSAISKSPTAESITRDNSNKIYTNSKMSISDKLNFLKKQN